MIEEDIFEEISLVNLLNDIEKTKPLKRSDNRGTSGRQGVGLMEKEIIPPQVVPNVVSKKALNESKNVNQHLSFQKPKKTRVGRIESNKKNTFNQGKSEKNVIKPKRNSTPEDNNEWNVQYESRNNHRESSSATVVEQNLEGRLSVSLVHHRFKNIFGFGHFNKLQSACFHKIYDSDDNVVISAPTGSGKSCCLELGMVRVLEKYYGKNQEKGKHKIIYIAPVKALVQEKYHEWKQKFSSLGINVGELTGDTHQVTAETLEPFDIILTTPEKYDSLSRKWRDDSCLKFVKSTELILIDEVHLLNEERGAVLEAIVSRIKSISSIQNHSSRIIALSATIPNIEDVAAWLDVSQSNVLVFGEEYRPSKLELRSIGYTNDKKNYFAFEKVLDKKLFDIIRAESHEKPTLVFCSSRNSTMKSAQQIVNDSNSFKTNYFITSNEQKERLSAKSKLVEDQQLREMLVFGVGFHSAQLSSNDRNVVESLFANRDLTVICTTSTLSQGLNTPAYLVIIKGTKIYQSGTGYKEYPSMNVLQMIGRAGRAGFEEAGLAIILTESNMAETYKNLASNNYVIESTLHKYIFEHLNAEICLQSVRDLTESTYWLKSTFLYARLQKNPEYYGLSTSEELEKKVEEILEKRITELADNQIIIIDGTLIKPTPLGQVMSRLYIQYKTMLLLLNSVGSKMNEKKILQLACTAEEFAEYAIRQGEKGVLITLNQNEKIKFPLKKKIEMAREKVFVLVQSVLASIPIESVSLRQQSVTLRSPLSRILSCLFEIAKNLGFGVTCRNSFKVARKVQVGAWTSGQLSPPTIKASQYKNGISIQTEIGSVHNSLNRFSLVTIESSEGKILAHRKVCESGKLFFKINPEILQGEIVCHICNSYGDESQAQITITEKQSSFKRKFEDKENEYPINNSPAKKMKEFSNRIKVDANIPDLKSKINNSHNIKTPKETRNVEKSVPILKERKIEFTPPKRKPQQQELLPERFMSPILENSPEPFFTPPKSKQKSFIHNDIDVNLTPIKKDYGVVNNLIESIMRYQQYSGDYIRFSSMFE